MTEDKRVKKISVDRDFNMVGILKFTFTSRPIRRAKTVAIGPYGHKSNECNEALQTQGNRMNELYIGILWMLYFGLHGFMGAEKTKVFLRKNLGPMFLYYRSAYTVFACFNFLLLFYLHSFVPSKTVFEPTLWTMSLSLILAIAGAVAAIGSLRHFPLRYWVVESHPGRLLTTGWYGVVRHPMYLGVFCILAAFVLWAPAGKNIVFVLVTAFAILRAAIAEEVRLAERFGEEYRDYRRSVPMFIPGLKRGV